MSMKFSDLLKNDPVKYEVKGRDFIFELKDGRKVKLACDKCGNTLWDIDVAEIKGEEKELVFRLICHMCGSIYLSFITPKK